MWPSQRQSKGRSASALGKILPLLTSSFRSFQVSSDLQTLPVSSQYGLMGKFKPMAKRPSWDWARKHKSKGAGWTGNPVSPLFSIKAAVVCCRMWGCTPVSWVSCTAGVVWFRWTVRGRDTDKAAKCQLSLAEGLQHLVWTPPAVTLASPPAEKPDHLVSKTYGAGSANSDCGILHSRWRNPDVFLSHPALFSHSLHWTGCIAELGHLSQRPWLQTVPLAGPANICSELTQAQVKLLRVLLTKRFVLKCRWQPELSLWWRHALSLDIPSQDPTCINALS